MADTAQVEAVRVAVGALNAGDPAGYRAMCERPPTRVTSLLVRRHGHLPPCADQRHG